MVDREVLWRKTIKSSKRKAKKFIRALNREIKKESRKGKFSASYFSYDSFNAREREIIQNYYDKLNYDYQWRTSDFLKVEWTKKENEKKGLESNL